MYQRGNQFTADLNDEFGRIEQAINLPLDAVRLDNRGYAPVKPRTGTISYANGTNWNPGFGAGPYYHNGTAWKPLAGIYGTYTPTLTNTTNLAASTAYLCQYQQVGSVVTVSGRVDVDPTAPGSCVLGMTLPVASALANDYELGGTAVCPAVAGFAAAILGDAANDRAKVQWVAVDIANQPLYFTFTYRVI